MARSELRLDINRLSDWFADIGLEFARPLRLKRIGYGQSNLIYMVEDDADHRWILRRPPHGYSGGSAHDVLREARILSALADFDVSTPKVLGALEAPEFTDAPVVLMEYIDGLVVDRMEVAHSLSTNQRQTIGFSLPRALAEVHSVDLEKSGLTTLASHSPYARRQVERWSGQWQRYKTRDIPDIDGLAQRLRRSAPVQREVTLVHGDFHLRNVILDRHTFEVASVLDWELSTLGDPLADMGSLLAYWPEENETTGGDFPASTLPGFPNRSEISAEYLKLTGRDAADLSYWHALGLWKVAIIAEGVLRRNLDNPANAAPGAGPGPELVDSFVEKALETALVAGI